MKMFIVNANQNQSVKNTISLIKANIGDDNVDVIEYGSQEHSIDADIPNTNRLTEILRKRTTVSNQNYDVLLIAGGHGNREPKSFNSLTPEGVHGLIRYFQDNKITFDHIFLGACFSAQFQLFFIPLLNGDSGSILACTSIATSNFCSLAEDIAKGEKPDIAPIITNGFEQQLSELVLTADEDIDEQLTNKLIEEFKPIKDQIETIAVVSEAENTEEGAITLLKTLQQEKNNALLAMIKNHHDDIMASHDKVLIGAVETTLCFYHKNTVYLRNKSSSYLPKDVALASDSQEEINKQLVIIKDIVRDLGNFDGSVKEITTPEIFDNYKQIFSAPLIQESLPTTKLDSPESDELEDSPPFRYS